MAKVDQSSAAIIVLFSGLLFGTTGTAAVISGVEANSTSLAATRLVIGATGLVLVAIKQRGLTDLIKLWKRPRVWIMGVSVATYMLAFFAAVSLAGAAVASLVSISLAPMLAGVIARSYGKPWPGRVWVLSTALAVTGVVLLSSPTAVENDNSRVIGSILAVLASTFYAFFTVVGAKLVDDEHHATDGLAASFSIGAVLLLPFLLLDSSWIFTSKGIFLALWLGVASTTLSYVLFGIGITHLAPGVVATLLLSEPAIATLLGVYILDEPMANRGWFGCFLIVLGLVLVSVNEQKKSRIIPL